MLSTYRVRIAENFGNLVTNFLWRDIQATSATEAQKAAEAIVAEHPELDLFVRFVVKLQKAGA